MEGDKANISRKLDAEGEWGVAAASIKHSDRADGGKRAMCGIGDLFRGGSHAMSHVKLQRKTIRSSKKFFSVVDKAACRLSNVSICESYIAFTACGVKTKQRSVSENSSRA